MVARLSRSPGASPGFTLFEMLVVLVIISILAAMTAPSAAKFMDSLAFRRKVAAVAAAMRYGRMRAVAAGRPITMELSREDGCFFVLKGEKEEERRRCYFDDDDEVFFEPSAKVRFFADGRTRPVEITIRSGERQRVIRVDILTGRPLVEKVAR